MEDDSRELITMEVSDMPSGTDADELFTDQRTETIFIPYNGKKWEFEVRKLTWEEEGELVSASTKMAVKKGQKGQKGNAEASFAVNVYNWLHIKKRVVKGPFPMNEATRRKISPAFGDLMIQYLVAADDDVSKDESKNSDSL